MILQRLVSCNGWAVHASNDDCMGFLYDNTVLLNFKKVGPSFETSVSFLPVHSFSLNCIDKLCSEYEPVLSRGFEGD